MKRAFRFMACLGLLTGVAALAERSAAACVEQYMRDDHCECHYKDWGWDICTTNGTHCFSSGANCNGGPPLQPF